jgi:hypothetical protein
VRRKWFVNVSFCFALQERNKERQLKEKEDGKERRIDVTRRQGCSMATPWKTNVVRKKGCKWLPEDRAKKRGRMKEEEEAMDAKKERRGRRKEEEEGKGRRKGKKERRGRGKGKERERESESERERE